DNLCVVNKSAGIPVQPDGTGDPSLLYLLSKQLHPQVPGLIHRLDRPVSGVVLFSLDAHTLRIMNEQFKNRKVEKHYWAIVEGMWEGGDRILEHWLDHDMKTKKSRISAEQKGEAARLNVKLLAQGDRFSLVEVVPEGGAFHQIRAQLAAAGHPIKGDVKYGARRGEKDRSIALHARSVAFHHPATDEKIEFTAPARTDGIWQPLLSKAGIGTS
ncbi:MAG: RluA family pseudouridine synthase, partial [Bacteroidota bacterium]|nr:RluA family pseudouridine synthase [Bacteroidota bacterium]